MDLPILCFLMLHPLARRHRYYLAAPRAIAKRASLSAQFRVSFFIRWKLQLRVSGTVLRGCVRKTKKKQDGDPPMNQLRACVSVSGALLLAALCGLLSAPPAHAQDDARRATPPPGKALVFVFRSEREPVAARVPVLVNLQPVGELENGTFITATVSPGRTHLRVGDRVLTVLSLEAAANQSYFVWVEAIAGLTPVRTDVRLVSESEGRRSIAQSRFLEGAAAAMAAAMRAQPGATQPAAAREMPAYTASGGGGEFALIASAGSFKLANQNQVLVGSPSTFDTTSKSVSSIEAEWRFNSGFALGGEAFYYKNTFVEDATSLSSQQEVLALMVNAKYYLRAASWFYPFVGVGIGSAGATYSGDFIISGTGTGLAYQGMAGVEFRFKHVGLHVQYKYLSSSTDDGSGEKVKVGGSGVLAGVSIIF
jgi:opacity protein-like surface antigen